MLRIFLPIPVGHLYVFFGKNVYSDHLLIIYWIVIVIAIAIELNGFFIY